jgi:hypothetical protein
MHVIGVALCFAMCMVNFHIQKTVLASYPLQISKRIKPVILVAISLALIIRISYSAAYGFDFVAYLIPLNHSKVKIYGMEGLNYFVGGYSLVNMILITSVASEYSASINKSEFLRLRKFFHISLFITALIVAVCNPNIGRVV